MKINKIKAFTLVELIVVITILAILGTIAFINLQGYSVSARDGKRVSDINNIMKKIGIESSKGTSLSTLINTTKTNSGLIIDGNSGSSIQGTANFSTLKEDGSKFKDPVTKGDYVFSYSVGGSGTGAYKFNQVSTVNEEENTAVVKGNYYKMQTGDTPSIIINEDDFFVEDGGVNLPYEIVEGITQSPFASCGTSGEIKTATSTYGLCNSPDIIVCSGNGAGVILAACNVGTNISGTGSSSYGNYFQWGNNGGTPYGNLSVSSTRVNTSLYGPSNYYNNTTIIGGTSLPNPYDWSNPKNDNLWGDTDYINGGSIDKSLLQGPCEVGYHVPTFTDWQNIVTNGNFTNGNNIQDLLKLPFAGDRYWMDGTMKNQGTDAYYWSSSPAGFNSYYLSFTSSSNFIYYSFNMKRAFDMSVRCFKN
ncbi:MAG: prepilin-type N-terminal cleavage/methylation domain-containing protein [Candidatus Gracilibacteria bacterium]|nr:prepilin-type N-terminal cleavage/methylation domain-containing protein [Candidatus Gracilibacteria bacterium]